ncbi:hypothetical protein JVU11DRAFT_1696 [Chiua virens]|nr:hypothetical protein JVU11DRAFT_1696 [Chiua virens]
MRERETYEDEGVGVEEEEGEEEEVEVEVGEVDDEEEAGVGVTEEEESQRRRGEGRRGGGKGKGVHSLCPAQSTSLSRKSHHSASAKKPDGISRELYSLIGPSAPSLAANLTKPRLKQKPNFGGGGIVKWYAVPLVPTPLPTIQTGNTGPFRNNARSDNLQLSHWVKATEPNADYPFAKYNVQSKPFDYSEDEYTRLLEDSEWTKEETDYLFSIVQEYDLRWYIIHDRYDYPSGPPRVIEVPSPHTSSGHAFTRATGSQRSLLQRLQKANQEPTMTVKKCVKITSPVSKFDPSEEIAEEEALFIELKRLEQNERKFRKDRDELLRTLLGVDSGLPDIVVEEDGPSSLSIEGLKKKKKGTGMDIDIPSTPSNIIQLGPPVTKKVSSVKSAIYDAQHCIVRVEPSTSSTSTTKATHVPVHLRSFKLPVPKATIAPKVTQALTELGITHSRLVMPTRENCARLESLIDATTALIETKKVMDKVDQEIRVLKARLGIRESESADRDGKESTPMMLTSPGKIEMRKEMWREELRVS